MMTNQLRLNQNEVVISVKQYQNKLLHRSLQFVGSLHRMTGLQSQDALANTLYLIKHSI